MCDQAQHFAFFFLNLHQSFHQEFVPPGCGSLVSRIFADGLTRVLRFEDEAEARRARQQNLNVRQLLPTFGQEEVSSDGHRDVITTLKVSTVQDAASGRTLGLKGAFYQVFGFFLVYVLLHQRSPFVL